MAHTTRPHSTSQRDNDEHRLISSNEVSLCRHFWQDARLNRSLNIGPAYGQSEHLQEERMPPKARNRACRNEPDECLRFRSYPVSIANPAFVPDACRIQEDRMAGPARALTKCRSTPMLDTHAQGQLVRSPMRALFPLSPEPPTGTVTLNHFVESTTNRADGPAASALSKKAVSMLRFSSHRACATVHARRSICARSISRRDYARLS